MQGKANEPTSLVIFGATGDLARRKLLPALFHLYSNGYLYENFRVVGLSKEKLSSTDFRNFARSAIVAKHPQHRVSELNDFLKSLEYTTGLLEDSKTYTALGALLDAQEKTVFAECSNKIFYLAVPPTLYESVFENLAESGLTIPCAQKKNQGQSIAATSQRWTRILVEKPFGRDLVTAQALDKKLGKLFHEDQIFRIDHYLAKETVQNIITFRFGNAIFEPIWNKENIENITVRQWETIGVGERASFYESVGALRDVGQNHLLQMLALIMMEDPRTLDPHAIRSARAKLLQSLQPISATKLPTNVMRGQYQGYKDSAEIDNLTQTETFFRLQTTINNHRWRGVPVTLEGGKKMPANKVEIIVTFKEPMSCVCPVDDDLHQNELTIRIQPDEGISLKFWAKKPGLDYKLEPRLLAFSYQNDAEQLEIPGAYEKVLYDCIRGDQTLFASTDEVSAAWRFITPILENWQDLPLRHYQPGTTDFS